MTRYRRRRVFLSHTNSEEPEEVIILSSHKDCGQYWYRCKRIDGGAIVDIPVRDVCSLAHRKSKVTRLKTKLKLVKS